MACNYTQEHVAKSLNISLKRLGEIERGKSKINIGLLDSLAQVLGTDVATLIGLTSRPDTTPPYLKQYVEKITQLPTEEQSLIFQLIEKLSERLDYDGNN